MIRERWESEIRVAFQIFRRGTRIFISSAGKGYP
jgi:hypothetical protein